MTSSTMTVPDAQREMRAAFANASVGGFVSGALWLASAAIGTWGSAHAAILALSLGGVLIFPVTMMVCRLLGFPGRLSPGNPLHNLGTEAALVVPLLLPVVFGAMHYKLSWFYPGLLVVVGAHYLPFVTLYGKPSFWALGMAMIVAGLGVGIYASQSFTLGGWVGGAMFVLYGVYSWVTREARA